MLEQATGDGVDCSRTGPGKGKAAMLEPDRRGTGVAAMSLSCSLVDQSRKTERNQEVGCNPQGEHLSQGRRNGVIQSGNR